MKEEVTPGLTRAAELFEDWLERVKRGSAEPYEEFAAHHPELREPLESMRRAQEGLEGILEPVSPSDAKNSARSRRFQGGHLAPGDELGDFRIVRELGRGGMGIVFETEQGSLHRRVALKILPAQLTLNRQALERFQREAAITSRLHHRGIIGIHQVGELDGIHFIVMELVEGASLDHVIDRMRGESFLSVRKVRIADIVSAHGLDDAQINAAPVEAAPARAHELPSAERGSGSPSKTRKASSSASNKNYIESAVRLVCQVADALDHAHHAGVIHRDIKPSNILVRGDGSPVLTDFGLARESGLPGITVTGAFAGTPNYVSPEQAMSGRVPVDHRSDIFSLGATLYELVTLHPAFKGENLHEVLSRIMTKPPVPANKLNSALAPDLVTILEKALEKDPDRRYQTATDLADDLRAFIEYRPIRARRTGTVVRAMRWVRREPLKAVLGVVLTVSIPVASLLWVSAVEARRDSTEARLRLETAELPDKLGDGFLRIGLGELEEAERVFREVLAQDAGSQEAAAGLAMAQLGGGRASEALQEIESFELTHPGALGRLRVEALRKLGQETAALEVERALRPPKTASDRYLDGVSLIYGQPFVAGLPSESLLPLLWQKTGSPLARSGDRGDALVEYRDRARKAILLLEHAIAEENRAVFHFALAWAAWVAGDAVVAERYAEVIAHKWPKDSVGRFYAALAREVFDPDGALAAHGELLEQDPGLWMARQRRAKLYLDRRESGLAVAEMKRLVEAAPDRLSLRVNLAQVLLLDGQLEAAGDAARGALEQDKGMAEAHDLLGCVLYAQRDLEGARTSFEAAFALGQGRAGYENHLGWTLFELGETKRALEFLERAHGRDPEDPLVANNLGLVYASQGRDEAAVEQFDRALERLHEPRIVALLKDRLLAQRGTSLSRLGRNDEAIASIHEALELARDNALYYAWLGDAADKAGRKVEALDAREKYLQLDIGKSDDYGALILELRRRNECVRALALAKRWTEAHETSAEAWNDRAWIQVDPLVVPPVGDREDALRSAQRAVDLGQGENHGFLDTLACAQFANGMVEEAIELDSRALELAFEKGATRDELRTIEGNLARFEDGLDSAER